MNNSNYAVVVTFSFDPRVSVLLFDTQEEAMNFIKKDIMEEYDIDLENGWDSEMAIFENEGRAVLTNHFHDKDDVIEWRIGDIFDHVDEEENND